MGLHDKISDEKAQEIADDLIKWVGRPDSFHLAGFTTQEKYRKTRTWLYSLAEYHKVVRDALTTAREILAEKYVSGLMTNRYSHFGEKYLPIYDIDYKDLLKWKEDIKSKEETKENLKPDWATNVEFLEYKANQLKHKEEYEEFLKWKESQEEK